MLRCSVNKLLTPQPLRQAVGVQRFGDGCKLASFRTHTERHELSWLSRRLACYRVGPAGISRETALEEGIRWLAMRDEFELRLQGEIADPQRRLDEACIRVAMRMGASRAEAEALLPMRGLED